MKALATPQNVATLYMLFLFLSTPIEQTSDWPSIVVTEVGTDRSSVHNEGDEEAAEKQKGETDKTDKTAGQDAKEGSSESKERRMEAIEKEEEGQLPDKTTVESIILSVGDALKDARVDAVDVKGKLRRLQAMSTVRRCTEEIVNDVFYGAFGKSQIGFVRVFDLSVFECLPGGSPLPFFLALVKFPLLSKFSVFRVILFVTFRITKVLRL